MPSAWRFGGSKRHWWSKRVWGTLTPGRSQLRPSNLATSGSQPRPSTSRGATEQSSWPRPTVTDSRQPGGPERVLASRRVAISLGNALVFSVSGGPQAAARAREELREQLGPKLDPEVVEFAHLLLSELVNNCVLHGVAGRPEVWIDVSAPLHPNSLWVEVSDGGPSFQHTPVAPSPEADSGRGLHLVDQLSSAWASAFTGRRVSGSSCRECPNPRIPATS